ncbi:MAG: Rrf2 family transcriptional regulator [candidate division Zixibacteria bacterium]|nr:Rrf2 family transcriptional regulator [candidate division Zixibacteria bacterium]MBU1471130.1 Rrf2 family transcriptional regulator [candidate division Zixibacteria bacterium]MBU2625639.1 Rrf2 family transcriptional regulator [candidate division Zixibacteria bacterium]
MKVTALEEYGLRCMVLLAKRAESSNPVTLAEIGEHEGLSVAYAAKLLSILRKAELVSAVRGRNGGYVLSKSPEDIVLKEVIDALGDPVFSAAHCSKFTGVDSTCMHISNCSVRNVWRGFDKIIGRLLDKITLADIISGGYDMAKTYSLSIEERSQAT